MSEANIATMTDQEATRMIGKIFLIKAATTIVTLVVARVATEAILNKMFPESK